MAIDPTPQVDDSTPSTSKALGVFQSDIVIRAMLVAALRDLRAHPYLLDYCFNHLVNDELTAGTYGTRERDKARRWFLRTDIPVVMDYRQGPPEGSQVSVALVDSTESENTFSDLHPEQVSEEVESIWPVLAGPFAATSYAVSTGTVTLPKAVSDELVVVPGMLLYDGAGRAATVTAVPGDKWGGKFQVAPGTQLDLTKGATIKGAKPSLIQQLESVEFRESYRIGAHAIGEPYLLTFLHSIVVFCLLRYKQALLEARGFERSVLSTGPFAKDERWSEVQNLWTRFSTVTGYGRTYWPKQADPRITTVTAQATFEVPDQDPVAVIPEPGFDTEDAPWLVQDGIGTPTGPPEDE